MSSNGFEYVFPAIRGVQAQREYYVSMCPLRLIPKIFLFDEEELVPELRAQRSLNRNRIPEMMRYIVDNPQDYVFSALTASVDGDPRFEPLDPTDVEGRIGLLHVPMSTRFIINDGQHRRAAIEAALRESPDLADESIAVVFFIDHGLERCQQMFADLNRYAIRPSKSIGVLYDHRDPMAQLSRLVVMRSEAFRDTVEMEKSTLARRSRKLFTLSAIHTATRAFLGTKLEDDDIEPFVKSAVAFWDAVAKQLPEWQAVRQGKMSAGEVRQDFIHSHSIALQALGHAGHDLLEVRPRAWKRSLDRLRTIDWSRSNTKTWEGRAMNGGRISKAGHNVALTTNVIKRVLDLELTPEEMRAEKAYQRGDEQKG